MNYRVKKSDLEELVRKVYDVACGGYFDLKEPICEKLIQDFINEKAHADTIVTGSSGATYLGGNIVVSNRNPGPMPIGLREEYFRRIRNLVSEAIQPESEYVDDQHLYNGFSEETPMRLPEPELRPELDMREEF